MNKQERFIKAHLDDAEQKFLIRYDQWLKTVFAHIPIGATEEQIHQYHLPNPAFLSKLLYRHVSDMLISGHAHGEVEAKALHHKHGVKLADLPFFDVNREFKPEEALEILRKREIVLAGQVESDLVSAIKDILLQHITGATPKSTQESIAHLLQGNMNRASLITTTETTYAYNRGRLISYRENNVDYVRFSAIMDGRTCRICGSRDGLVKPIDEIGSNTPPVHGRCRCVLTPIYSRYEPHLITPENLDWSKVEPLPKGWVTNAEPDEKSGSNQVGVLNDLPKKANQKFNPKASFYVDVPGVSEHVNEQLAMVNRKLARDGYKGSKEILAGVDAVTGNQLFRKDGIIDMVSFHGEPDRILRSAKQNSVILTHNHPAGSRINFLDLENMVLYPSISTLMAVTHSGNISFISNNGRNVDRIRYGKDLETAAYEVDSMMQKLSGYATMSVSAKDEYLLSGIAKRLAKEWGWSYVEEEAPTGKNYRKF